MLALLGYPFLFEPWVTTRMQASAGRRATRCSSLLCAACAWYEPAHSPRDATRGRGAGVAAARRRRAPAAAAPSLLWLALAAMGSLLLLAVTNHITQNIASIPLLWIVPLDDLPAHVHPLLRQRAAGIAATCFLAMLAGVPGVMAWTCRQRAHARARAADRACSAIGLFVACMFCHGELAALKPGAALSDAVLPDGFARRRARSALVGIVAPLVLPAYFELAFGLVAARRCWRWQIRREPSGVRHARRRSPCW